MAMHLIVQTTFTRFAAVYALLNTFNYGIWILPYGRELRHLQMNLTFPLVRFFGSHVLGMEDFDRHIANCRQGFQ